MRTDVSRQTWLASLLSTLMAVACMTPASALTALDDEQMADVSGAGLAAVWEDFRFLMKPTSYFEQVGSTAAPGTTFQRGDLRWYGISMSGKGNAASSYSWTETGGNMSACAGGGIAQTGCPVAITVIGKTSDSVTQQIAIKTTARWLKP